LGDKEKADRWRNGDKPRMIVLVENLPERREAIGTADIFEEKKSCEEAEE
jgi:hypothetical protein